MDRVQVLKRETAALGGDAADEAPWDAPIEPQEDAIETAGVYLQDAANRDEAALIFRDGDDIKFKDGNNVTPITLTTLTESAGGGVTEAQHRALRQLIHFIDDGPAEGFASGAFKEIVGGMFPTSIIWWESASKLKKIVEKTVTRSGGLATNVKPTPIEWKMYDTDGTTVLATVSDAVTYSGIAEATRTRTITV